MVEELDMESPVPWPSEVLQLPIACVGTARHNPAGAEVKTGHPTSDPGLFEPAGMKLALSRACEKRAMLVPGMPQRGITILRGRGFVH